MIEANGVEPWTGFDRRPHLLEPGRRVDAGQDPGRAGGLPGLGGCAGLDLDDEIEGLLRIVPELAQLCRHDCEVIRPREVDREVAVPARSAADRRALRPAPRDPDGDARPLDRGRLELPGPELPQTVQALVEQL